MIEKNYIIQAHQSPLQLKRLIDKLNDDKSFFFVHIDLKSEIEPFKTLIIGENILFIEDRVDCIWADFSQVVATNKLIESVIKSQRDGITILLSGQDYPVKNKSYINS